MSFNVIYIFIDTFYIYLINCVNYLLFLSSTSIVLQMVYHSVGADRVLFVGRRSVLKVEQASVQRS